MLANDDRQIAHFPGLHPNGLHTKLSVLRPTVSGATGCPRKANSPPTIELMSAKPAAERILFHYVGFRDIRSCLQAS